MANIITVILNLEKTTKNCAKFAEKCESEFVPEKLGSLYVPKSTLAEIGYRGGQIIAELSLADGTVHFNPEKTTKNCVKFAEITENEFVPEKIGSLYIPKSTLQELKYDGKQISVTLKLPE